MTRQLSLALLMMMLVAGGAGPGVLAAQDAYETPPVLKASEILPAEALTGDHFKVASEVINDGVMNHYVVTTEYGEFAAYGNLELAKLIHQIDAIAEVEAVSTSKQFLDALGNAATDQLDTVKDVGQHPATVAKALPKGVFHMFRRYKREAELGVHVVSGLVGDEGEEGDQANGYAEEWASVTDSERAWYQKLEVDPYNHNQVLRDKVTSVARVDAVASVGLSFAPIPSIPGADYLHEVTEAVWTTDPADLKKKNIERLQEAGVDDETVQVLMNSGFVSPTQQTQTVSILEQLEGVDGREVIVGIAAPADSLELAQFNLANASFLAAYHRSETPLTAIFPGAPIPVAMTSNGGLIILVSADYAFWVEDLAGVFEIMAKRFADRDASSRELWLRGTASPRFVAEAADLGWTVRQSIDLKARELQPGSESRSHQ